jgi:hypothetical protein
VTRSQMIWLLTALLGVALFVAVDVASWPLLHTVCRSACHSGQPDVATARTLHSLGISLQTFAIFSIARDAVVGLIWFTVGGLIIFLRPRDRGPVISAFFLLLFTANAENAVTVPPALQPLAAFTSFTAGSALVVFGLVFPDGRFVPRWMRWVALALILMIAGTTLFPGSPVDASGLPVSLQVFLFLLPTVIILGAQVYRYRRVSSWQQRQQMKWALFGLGVALAGLVILNLGYGVVPDASRHGSLYDVATYTDFPLFTTVIPISIGIAMLRSRLWDVDRVINRTLVYGSLTVLLAALYIGGVVLLQSIFRALTGQGSGLAVAISTLAIAALFQPLRRGMQSFIDRRFYRRKYDAARTLAALSAHLRDDIDLDQISSEIVGVVRETMQPTHVSIWLQNDPHRYQGKEQVRL